VAAIEPKTVILKNGQEVCIRTPTVDDVPKTLDYLKAIFQEDRFFGLTAEEAKDFQTPQKQQERTDDHYRDDKKLLVVTVAGDKIVSMSHVEAASRIRNQHVAEVGISILSEYRGHGLGTAIMQAMIGWATAHPIIEKLSLGVWNQNTAAIRLYEKMGFIEEGRKIKGGKYADGSYDDMVCMYRVVEQGV
jgi:RimJ/RimL family protein N-acetyltransferase